MSVPEPLRHKGRLEVHVKAQYLASYTIKILQQFMEVRNMCIIQRKEIARLQRENDRLRIALNEKTEEQESALVELADLFSAQDDAIVELAEILAE